MPAVNGAAKYMFPKETAIIPLSLRCRIPLQWASGSVSVSLPVTSPGKEFSNKAIIMRSLIIGLLLLSTGAAVRAQDTILIASLSEALASALKNNPTQAVYQQQIRQARYNYKATKGAFYPNATGSLGGTDNLHLATTPIPGELVGAPGTTYYAQFGKQYAYNAGITLTQNIVNWQAVLETKVAEDNIRLT